MRLLPAVVAAFGLLRVGHALGQYSYDSLGIMNDIAPGFWEDEVVDAEEPSLVKRDGGCGDGKHPCSDVNSTLCCSNDQYCIVNSTWGIQCCALGSTCGSKCDVTHYFANTTKAVTTTLTTTLDSASSSTRTETEATVKTTTSSVCSPRQCTSTNYLCASSFGGGCCAYGSDCASSGQCIGPSSTSSESTSTSALISLVPSGCSAQGQTLCTAGSGISGSGCCDAGYACATYSASLVCSFTPSSSLTATATATGVTVEHTGGGGSLSTGAKAGIAIGVILATAAVIGALTWLCLRRRRRDGRSTTTGNEMRSVPPGNNPNNHHPSHGGAGMRHPWDPASIPRHMSGSDGYAPSSTQISRGAGGGLDRYFGGSPEPNHHYANNDDDTAAAAAANNYTWDSGAATAGSPLTYTQQHQHPYYDDEQQQQQQQQAGSTAPPHGPDNVSAPVEIGHGGSASRRPTLSDQSKQTGGVGSGPRGRGYSQAGSDGGHSELADTSSGGGGVVRVRRNPSYQGSSGGAGGGVRDSIAGRFELYGSETGAAGGAGGGEGTILPQPFPTPGSEMSEFGTPSPMSREEEQLPRREV